MNELSARDLLARSEKSPSGVIVGKTSTDRDTNVNNLALDTSVSPANTPEVNTSENSGLKERLAYFKHDTGHLNFAFVDSDGYYDLLAFANDNDPVASIDNLSDNLLSPESSEDNENREEPDNDIEDSQSNENSQQGLAKSPEIQTQVFKTPQIPTTSSRKSKKRNLVENDMSDFMQTCSKALQASTEKLDEYEAMGINYAAKLKKMAPEQQIYAELLFQKVLTKGLLGQLHQNVDLVDRNLQEASTTPVPYMYTNFQHRQSHYYQSVTPPATSPSSESTSSLQDYYNNFDSS